MDNSEIETIRKQYITNQEYDPFLDLLRNKAVVECLILLSPQLYEDQSATTLVLIDRLNENFSGIQELALEWRNCEKALLENVIASLENEMYHSKDRLQVLTFIIMQDKYKSKLKNLFIDDHFREYVNPLFDAPEGMIDYMISHAELSDEL